MRSSIVKHADKKMIWDIAIVGILVKDSNDSLYLKKTLYEKLTEIRQSRSWLKDDIKRTIQ